MNTILLLQSLTDTAQEGNTENWWVSSLLFVVTGIASGVGGYIGAYVVKRGELTAMKREFPELLRQLRESTEAAGKITNQLSLAKERSLTRLEIAQALYEKFIKVLLQFKIPIPEHLDKLDVLMSEYFDFLMRSKIRIDEYLYSQIEPHNNELSIIITEIRNKPPEKIILEGWFWNSIDEEAQKREVQRLADVQELYRRGQEICAKIQPLIEEYYGKLDNPNQDA